MRERFEVVWNGSKAMNRGYLGLKSEPLRVPVPLPDLSALSKSESRSALHASRFDRLVALITVRPYDSRELEQALGCSQSMVVALLSEARRKTAMQNVKQRKGVGARKFVNFYWIGDVKA